MAGIPPDDVNEQLRRLRDTSVRADERAAVVRRLSWTKGYA
jgi:hypothetical protein